MFDGIYFKFLQSNRGGFKMKESNLSEKIVDDSRSEHVGYIHIGWVKEFIKAILKDPHRDNIRKLAGDKLL